MASSPVYIMVFKRKKYIFLPVCTENDIILMQNRTYLSEIPVRENLCKAVPIAVGAVFF